MADLFDYVRWRGDITFEQVPFNDIDALMLSHISYLNFDGLVSESFNEAKSLQQLAEEFKADPNFDTRKDVGFLINEHTSDLMFECAASERFKDVKICAYRTKYDETTIEQFAAMTYFAGGKTVISYRGTDDTLVGWREDFNIVWQNPIPAQADSLEYIQEAVESLKDNFIIVGHSKGGNLVVNTAVKCGEKIQKRIEKLYNFDGPGFSADFYKQKEYLEIEPKLISVYPEFSVVGMVFRHPEKFIITKSNGFAVMQHDAMTWQIMGSKFDEAPDFKDESKFFYKAFNDWVDGLTTEQTHKFVTALWDVVNAAGVKTNSELQANAIPCTAKMISKLSSLDKSTKKEVRAILAMLRSTVRRDSPFAKIFGLQKS